MAEQIEIIQEGFYPALGRLLTKGELVSVDKPTSDALIASGFGRKPKATKPSKVWKGLEPQAHSEDDR